jgi:multidrug efflux pump subunit AcrA (membrane-fusion protein)
MTTVINNPPGNQDSGSGTGLMLGIIIAIVIIAGIVLFAMYGSPKTQNNPNPGNSTIDVNVKVPDVKVPDINVTPTAPATTPAP